MLRLFVPVLFSFAAMAAGAGANDSVARLGAGGLILVYADDISMDKEDLFISPTEVRVDYVFRNTAKEDRTYLVAFPMPEIEAPGYLESDIAVPDRQSENFMHFTVTVAGGKIEPKLDMRALTGGIDVTDRLSALGVSLNPLSQAAYDAVNKLTRDTLGELIAMGALRRYENALDPSWTLKSSYYWLQTFPAGSTIEVSHTYQPAAGAAFFYKGLLEEKPSMDEYCIDGGTAKAISKRLSKLNPDFPYMMLRDIQYVLSSGANWLGPIKDFHLTVDKGKRDAIVSFCMDGVEKTGPTTFEVHKANFNPEKDLSILLVEDAPQQ